MQTALLLFVALAIHQAPAANPAQVQIDLKLYEEDAKGRPDVLSRPSLHVLVGQPGVLQVGQEIAMPANNGKDVAVRFVGLRVEVLAKSVTNNKVTLDICVEKAGAAQTVRSEILDVFDLNRIVTVEFARVAGQPKLCAAFSVKRVDP